MVLSLEEKVSNTIKETDRTWNKDCQANLSCSNQPIAPQPA